MLKLYVPSESAYLDTTGVSLQLNYSEADIKELAKPVRPHSLAFKLPFTDVNNRVLKFLEIVDNSVETRGRIDCEVYDGDNLVLAGGLSVRSADLQARKYDCVIYSNDAGVWQQLKRTRWADVFTSNGTITTSLDHDHTAENIAISNQWVGGGDYTSNDITDGSLGNDIIWYCPQITGLRYLDTDQMYFDNADWSSPQSDGPLPSTLRKVATDYTPTFQVKYLLQQLMLHLGYTLRTDIADDVFTPTDDDAFTGTDALFEDLYYMVPHGSIKYRPYYGAYLQALELIAGVNHPNIIPTASFNKFGGNNPYDDPTTMWFRFSDAYLAGGGYDPDGFFPSDGFGMFSPLAFGSWAMRLTFNVTLDGTAGGPFTIGVRPYEFSSGQFGQIYTKYIPQNEVSSSMQIVVDFTFEHTTSNDTWAFVPVWYLPSGITAITLELNGTYIEVVSYSGDSRKVQVPSTLGEDTCDKFLSSIMQRFNLLMTFDDNRKTCRMHRRKDFYERDVLEAKDWSAKVDSSKSMVLTNNLENISKTIEFYDEEGDDGRSKWWQENLGKKYTDWTYNSGIEYATGEQKIGGYFAPARFRKPSLDLFGGGVDSIDGTDYDYPQPHGVFKLQQTTETTNGGQVNIYEIQQNTNPILVYKSGSRLNSKPVRVYDSTMTQAAHVDITDWTGVSVRSFHGGTYLSFSPKSSYDELPLSDADSIYRVHYEEDVRERYSVDARVLTCDIYLNAIDIANVKYSDLIFIDGTYYYILAISNYVVGQNQSCKIKLRKMLTGAQVRTGSTGCSGVVSYTIAYNGIVSFFDRFGVAVQATEACCAYFGGGTWEWNAYTGNCLSDTLVDEDFDDDFAFSPTHNGDNLNYGDNIVQTDSSDGDQIDRTYRFSLQAQTKGNTTAQAKDSRGQDKFSIVTDMVVGIEVTYVCRVTNATNYGDMQFGKTEATFRVEGGSISKTASDDKANRGDASSTDVAVSVTNADGIPRFTIDCTGNTGDDLTWQFDVVMRTQDITNKIATNDLASIIMQNGNVLLTETPEIITYE